MQSILLATIIPPSKPARRIIQTGQRKVNIDFGIEIYIELGTTLQNGHSAGLFNVLLCHFACNTTGHRVE